MFYDSEVRRVKHRGLIVALAINSIFLLTPLLSATLERYPDAYVAANPGDMYEGSGLLVLYSGASCAMGCLVALLLGLNFGDPWAKPAFLLQAFLLIATTATGAYRHQELRQQLTRVHGTTFNSFP